MTPALLPRPLIRRHDNHRCAGGGRPGNHILQELLMPGGVDDGEPALSRPKMDLGSVDRDVLLLLLSERIKDKRILEPPAFPRTSRPNRLEFSLRKRVRRFEDAPNHGRLS